MRILVASSYAPLRCGHGNELQVWHVVDQLRRHHDVSVVYYGTHSDLEGVSLRAVEPVPWSVADRAATLARGFLRRGVPSLVAQMSAAGLPTAVAQVAQEFRPDVLYVTSTHAAEVIDVLPQVPRVLNVIDSWAYMERGMALDVSGWQRARQQHKLDGIYRYEKKTLDRFDSVITVSELDRRFMLEMDADVPIHVVSNGVKTDFFTPRPADRPWPTAPVLTFHGIMNYVPNEGAAQRLVDGVMPLVWRTHPDVRVQLVGRNPGPPVLALAGDRVEVTGGVDDIRPYLWDAAVCVFSIFTGSGVKNKLLEASSMAKPMVATPSAIGDLALREGQEALVRNDNDGLAEAIVQLIENPDKAAALGEAARLVVEEYHSWTEVGHRIGQICADAVAQVRPETV